MSFYFIQSKNRSPYYNLTVEDQLFKLSQKGDTFFYIWESSPSVVYGRFQNPWKECNLKQMQCDGVLPVRRFTGGGAVLHGEGNINFCYINRTDDLSLSTILLTVLTKLGFKVDVNGKNDLLIAGKKISGSAGRKSKWGQLTHCTLLVDFDRTNFSKYLTSNNVLYKGNEVNSIPSKTVSLSELDCKIDVESVLSSLTVELKGLGALERDLNSFDFILSKEFSQIRENLLSLNWLYYKTPGFIRLFKSNYFKNINLGINVKKGVVSSFYNIPVNNNSIKIVENDILNLPYQSDLLKNKLLKLSKSKNKSIAQLAYQIKTELF